MAPTSDSYEDPFANIAEFYDLDFEDFWDDVSFYQRLVEIHGNRVLELGIGTGRVSVPLAEAGAKVTGVDLSPGMMAIAQQRAQASGVSLTCIEADIRRVRLRGRFDVVTAPLGTLQHLPTPSDFVETLEVMARHLAPGGIAVVDVEAPIPDDFDPMPQPLVQHWNKPWRDGRVSKLVAVDAMPSEGTKEITWHFDVTTARGQMTRVTTQFNLRTFTPAEIELAARIAGLRIAAQFAGYDFTPFGDGAERLVVILQRADDPVGYIYDTGDDGAEDPT